MRTLKGALAGALFLAWASADAVAADQTAPLWAQEPPPSPSVIVQGKVAVLLADGFLLEKQEGGYTLVETLCPAMWLGLERGDRVNVFGGMGTRGGIASGAITMLLPGYELPIRDGWCQR